MESMIKNEQKCAICNTTKFLSKYYVFKDKKKSNLYGCWCWLCVEHYIRGDKAPLREKAISEFTKRYRGVRISEIFKELQEK